MNLVINSQFRPFTYDELAKPLVAYKQEYDKVEQDYSDLVTQTEMWADIANRENSPEAYAMYQKYSNALNSVVDDFSRGMNATNRGQLLNMKRRYAREITPIAQASEAMKAANEYRAKMGPDAIFQVGEYNSIDQFLHGKTANNNWQSREALTKRTAAMTEAAMAEALKDPEFKKAMGDQFWQITQHTGGSYSDMLEAMKLGMADNPLAQNRFSEIRQRVLKDAGIENYDVLGQRAIMDAVDTGLYAGLDKPVRSFQANADHITEYQKKQLAHANSQLALSAASNGMKLVNGKWVYDANNDPAVKKAEAVAKARADSKGGGGSGGGTERAGRLKEPIKVMGHKVGNNGSVRDAEKKDSDEWYGMNAGKASVVKKEDIEGTLVDYNSLPPYLQAYVDTAIGDDDINGYTYYLGEESRGMLRANDEVVYIYPKTNVINQSGDLDLNMGINQ